MTPTTPRDFFGSVNKSSRPFIDSHTKKIFNYEPLLENKQVKMRVTNQSVTKVEANQLRQGTSLNSFVDMSSHLMNQSRHQSSARSSEIGLVFENVNRAGHINQILD